MKKCKTSFSQNFVRTKDTMIMVSFIKMIHYLEHYLQTKPKVFQI